MNGDDVKQNYSVKEAPAGFVWAVHGQVLSRHPGAFALPVLTKRLYVQTNGNVIADSGFVISVVQARTRMILRTAREPVGDVTFASRNLSFTLPREESALCATVAEAQAEADALAAGPLGEIEEELTLATIQGLQERLATPAPVPAGAGVPPAAP